jgi:hypothetical protein
MFSASAHVKVYVKRTIRVVVSPLFASEASPSFSMQSAAVTRFRRALGAARRQHRALDTAQ